MDLTTSSFFLFIPSFKWSYIFRVILFRSILKWIWDDQRANDWIILKSARWESFFMVKSFITFCLFQYHKNASNDELFLSVYSILKMELCFPGLVKNYSKISALGCLESVANKKSRVPRKKKQHVKKSQLVR